MKFFLKYLLILLAIGLLLILYFLKTDIGHQNLGYFIEDYLSTETCNKIKVHSLNLENYPYIVIELKVNDRAKITLKGNISNYDINMSYHLRGDSFYFNNLHLDNKLDIHGNLFGAFDSLKVDGDGELFDGKVNYKFINTPKTIKKLTLKMHKVNSKKLLTFLGEKPLVKGLADVDVKFKSFSYYSKYGKIKVSMEKASIDKVIIEKVKELPFALNLIMNFNNTDYKYEGNITSNTIGTLLINRGTYNRGRRIFYADYKLHLKDLEYLKKIVEHQYKGVLNIDGNLTYNSYKKYFIIKGNSKEFKGNIDFTYTKDSIDFKLKKVSLEHLLKKLSYPVIFTSDIDGIIDVNLKEKIVIINTHLKNTRFLRSNFTDTLQNRARIDVLSSVYNKSTFSAGYENNKISLSLNIANSNGSIRLRQTKIDLEKNIVNSNFQIKMQGQEYFGKIYGSLDNPKFKIDKRKFMRFQTEKYLSDWLRTKE